MLDRSSAKGRKQFLRPNKLLSFGQLNCRTLSSLSSKKELNKLVHDHNIAITCIQEHRIIHAEDDPHIVTTSLGDSSFFTSSTVCNSNGAAIGGIGILINKSALSSLSMIKRVNDRIMVATFCGNPKTTVVCCYAPHNESDEHLVETFYQQLSQTIDSIPVHSFLIVGGDFNAHCIGLYSYHDTNNRNGDYLTDFVQQHNLIISNTRFQKPKHKLWTWRSPRKTVSQIDYILFRKRWRNSVVDCQAYSTSDPIGSDHRMVTAKTGLSLRTTKSLKRNNLNWSAISTNQALAENIENQIYTKWAVQDINSESSYTKFVNICITVGKALLPEFPKSDRKSQLSNNQQICKLRNEVLMANIDELHVTQKNLREAYDIEEDKNINIILSSFESNTSTNNTKAAWKLIKKLSGKQSSSVVIQGEDRLNTWKNHFESLLNVDSNISSDDLTMDYIFPPNNNISTSDFSYDELNTTVKQMKSGKAPGLDDLPLNLWKLPKLKNILLEYCNITFNGHRPSEWGISGIVPIPKKGDLTHIC